MWIAGMDFKVLREVKNPLLFLLEALELTNKAVVEALDGLPPRKIHCSVLSEEAAKAAIKDFYDKNGIEYYRTKFTDCASCRHYPDGSCRV